MLQRIKSQSQRNIREVNNMIGFDPSITAGLSNMQTVGSTVNETQPVNESKKTERESVLTRFLPFTVIFLKEFYRVFFF